MVLCFGQIPLIEKHPAEKEVVIREKMQGRKSGQHQQDNCNDSWKAELFPSRGRIIIISNPGVTQIGLPAGKCTRETFQEPFSRRTARRAVAAFLKAFFAEIFSAAGTMCNSNSIRMHAAAVRIVCAITVHIRVIYTLFWIIPSSFSQRGMENIRTVQFRLDNFLNGEPSLL